MNPISPDVTELMERIRHESRAQQRHNGAHATELPALELPALAGPLPPPPQPANAGPAPAAPTAWEALTDMVTRARRKITVSDWIPGFLRPLARNQGGYNGILLEAIERLGEANQLLQQQFEQQLHERTAALRADLQAQSAWLKALVEARETERAWMRAVEPCLTRGAAESNAHGHRAEQALSRLARIEEQMTYLRSDLDQLGMRNNYHETHASDLDKRLTHLQRQADEQAGRLHGSDRLGEHLLNLQRQADSHHARLAEVHVRLDHDGQNVNRLGENLGNLQKQADHQNRHITEVHEHLDRVGQHLDRLGERLEALQRQFEAQAGDLRRE